MKKKFLLSAVLLALSLTSCSLFNSYKTYETDIDIYNIDKIANNDGANLSTCYDGTIKARFISGEKYVPYFSLSQYASFYLGHYDKGAKNEISTDSLKSQWTISVNDEICFVAAVSNLQRAILTAGDISYAFASDDSDRDLKALSYAIESKASSQTTTEDNYATYSFKNYGFKYFKYKGEYYYPLGLYDLAFSDSSSIYFTYNYKHIYSSRDTDNFSKVTFRENNALYTVDSQMKLGVEDKTMPSYLIKYNAGCFLFLMDNLYGLKNNKKIKSMKDYYSQYVFYEGLYSSDNKTRSDSYQLALNVLDDHHTAMISVNDSWGEAVDRTLPGGEGVVARSYLNKKLLEMREAYYTQKLGAKEKAVGEVLYSNNGKTAMFHFESFSFGTTNQVFNPDGSLSPNAYQYDTFYNMIDKFTTIKNRGGVQNVIIDVSTNGGGTIGVMMKLLCLISKNNHATNCFYDEPTGVATIYNSRVDANDDKQYTDDEVFGDDFNIYLLTSDCSFSCGNAFPCYAQKMGVKIIGDKSGGGECAVSIHYLPNSQYVYHSSNLHIGYFDTTNKIFSGFESGATPDIPLNNNKPMCYFDNNGYLQYDIPTNFYDIEALSAAINR